jgi:hypothetical protein
LSVGEPTTNFLIGGAVIPPGDVPLGNWTLALAPVNPAIWNGTSYTVPEDGDYQIELVANYRCANPVILGGYDVADTLPTRSTHSDGTAGTSGILLPVLSIDREYENSSGSRSNHNVINSRLPSYYYGFPATPATITASTGGGTGTMTLTLASIITALTPAAGLVGATAIELLQPQGQVVLNGIVALKKDDIITPQFNSGLTGTTARTAITGAPTIDFSLGNLSADAAGFNRAYTTFTVCKVRNTPTISVTYAC